METTEQLTTHEVEDSATSCKEGERSDKEETGKMNSKRVEQLSRFLKKQQEVVYKQENISKFFPQPLQKVAVRCWEQIHPNISSAIEGKYSSVLEEMGINEKLAQLDQEQSKCLGFMPAWRPTGIPEEDSRVAEINEGRNFLPEFQSRLLEAEEMSRNLQQQMREKEAELDQLDTEIATAVASIQHITSSFPLPSSTTSPSLH